MSTHIQMRYVDCNQKFVLSFIIIAGLVLSVWSNTISVLACMNRYTMRHNPVYFAIIVISSSQITHLILSLAGAAGLIHGMKKCDRDFLKPWLILKVVELIALFIGSIIIATTGRLDYIGLTPVGILCCLLNCYITLSVWDTYKKMIPEPVDTSDDNNSVPEKPPSYESFVNQETHII